MQNDLKYTVRSREIVDLYSAVRTERLTLNPYFQRNLVWRDAHKKDFLDTILKGYPFPQIFLARGPINLETMAASQAVVDGQQRLTTIRDFISGKIDANAGSFKDLDEKIKESFLKYEVAVIDFDLDAADPRLKDVFHRLNRTFYSLSAIEKLASEYSASDFMLVARVLCGEITNDAPSGEDESELGNIGSEDDVGEVLESNIFSRDPGVDDAAWNWLLSQAGGFYATLLRSHSIFSSFEFDRKVPLMFTLNIMCTYLAGYYERNDRVRRFLDDKSDEFPEKDEVLSAINETASFVTAMQFDQRSPWWNKANLFTLIVELSRNPHLRRQSASAAAEKLNAFATSFPDKYSLAAREAVGRKPQRELRGTFVREVLGATPST